MEQKGSMQTLRSPNVAHNSEHWQSQKLRTDRLFENGPRPFVVSPDRLSTYLTAWRLQEGARRLLQASGDRLSRRSTVLVLCGADGYDGSILCDFGFEDVTVSDISPVAVEVALKRDPRLRGLALNAEETGLDRNSFDIVVVQDALHHLQRPVQGFTEMLRISRCGVMFLEPHDSPVGRLVGTRWEVHDEARNYVFRWNKKMVGDVASSYIGADSFRNLSFSFWHHNILYSRLARLVGNGKFSIFLIRSIKASLDALFGRVGNQICGLILKD